MIFWTGSVHRPKFGEIRGPMVFFLGGFIGGDFSIPTYEQVFSEKTGRLPSVLQVSGQ